MNTRIFFCCLLTMLCAGCASGNETFYWGDYSSTLYDLKKNPEEKTLKAHEDQLLLIMTESAKKGKPIPPGVQAEYGYLLLRDGKESEGLAYLEKEMTLYPESAVFVQRLRDTRGRGKGK